MLSEIPARLCSLLGSDPRPQHFVNADEWRAWSLTRRAISSASAGPLSRPKRVQYSPNTCARVAGADQRWPAQTHQRYRQQRQKATQASAPALPRLGVALWPWDERAEDRQEALCVGEQLPRPPWGEGVDSEDLRVQKRLGRGQEVAAAGGRTAKVTHGLPGGAGCKRRVPAREP